MGFWESSNILEPFWAILLFAKDILQFQPDVIVYIDYPRFNMRIAKWAKTQGFKNHYYISPQIWAWKENRIKAIKRDLDALYVILPFEENYFKMKHNFPVEFVGNPLVEVIKQERESKTVSLLCFTPRKTHYCASSR